MLTFDLQLHPQPLVMVMMPGLTEEEFLRYEELLDVKCQYERHKQQQEVGRGGGEEEVEQEEGPAGEEGEEPLRRAAGGVSCNVSEHEMALIEEELRHLEFKCRNILRAQKMQQLRERCLKAWMMEESAAAATGTRPPGLCPRAAA